MAQPDDCLPPQLDLDPDVILPSQWGGAEFRWTPERRLMLAVLEDAVGTILRGPSRERRWTGSAEEAMEWVAANDRQWPFSFINTTETLGLDPGAVRRGIDEARKRSLPLNASRWRRESIHTTRIVNGPVVAADSPELRHEYAMRGGAASRRKKANVKMGEQRED